MKRSQLSRLQANEQSAHSCWPHRAGHCSQHSFIVVLKTPAWLLGRISGQIFLMPANLESVFPFKIMTSLRHHRICAPAGCAEGRQRASIAKPLHAKAVNIVPSILPQRLETAASEFTSNLCTGNCGSTTTECIGIVLGRLPVPMFHNQAPHPKSLGR